MKHKRQRMADNMGNKFALCHMIGQSVELFDEAVPTALIANWMNVSKTTAIKRLNQMVKDGLLIRHEKPYRPNATAFLWMLSPRAKSLYQDKRYIRDYEWWVTVSTAPHSRGMFV